MSKKSAVFVFMVWALAAAALAGEEKAPSPTLGLSRPFQLTGYAQASYTWANDALDTFTLRRARLSLSGDLVRNVKMKLQVDLTKSPVLLEAMVDAQLASFLAVRLGQFFIPFGRECRTSSAEVETVLRAQISDKLAPGRDNGASGRDIGIQISGKISIFEYLAGVFNGAGINKLDDNEHKDVCLRISAEPASFLTLGASMYEGRSNAAAGAPLAERDRTGLDAVLILDRVRARAEYIHGRDGLLTKEGWYLLSSVDILPKKFQALAKWDSYDPDKDSASDQLKILTFGLNWWLADRTRIQLNAGWSRKEGSHSVSRTLVLQFQAGF